MKNIIKNFIYRLFNRRFLRKGQGEGAVYITYDDGPHPTNTRKILKVLEKYNIKATFFMIGACMMEYPEIVYEVKDAGHTIGFHSYHHKSLKDISLREIYEDLGHARSLSKRFDYQISLYRPPFGDLSVFSFLLIILSGWKIVMWSLDSRDSFDTLEQVQQNLDPDKITDGEIILFHDDYSNAVELIESTLEKLITIAVFNCKKL